MSGRVYGLDAHHLEGHLEMTWTVEMPMPWLCDSEALTREEMGLRMELLQWAQEKYIAGHRPVSIAAALTCAGKECIKDGDRSPSIIFAK